MLSSVQQGLTGSESGPDAMSSGPWALVPAFAASLAVHAAIAVSLVALIAVGSFSLNVDSMPLVVRLTSEPIAPVPETATVTLPDGAHPAVPAQVPIEAPEIPAQARASPVVQEVVATPPDANPNAMLRSHPMGDVDVTVPNVLSLLPDELAYRAQGEYPVEIDQPVQLLAMPDVPYPPAALKAGLEGSVLAWVAVNAEGEPEEVVVGEGASDFAAPVSEALQKARFAPAEADGHKIRFYAILKIDFRSGEVRTDDGVPAKPTQAGLDPQRQ
jgi:periplasmic protein TonB